MSEPIEICNLADHNTKLELMKVAIETLSKNPDMGIVVALLICTFMQSLADTSNSLFYKYFDVLPDNSDIKYRKFKTKVKS